MNILTARTARTAATFPASLASLTSLTSLTSPSFLTTPTAWPYNPHARSFNSLTAPMAIPRSQAIIITGSMQGSNVHGAKATNHIVHCSPLFSICSSSCHIISICLFSQLSLRQGSDGCLKYSIIFGPPCCRRRFLSSFYSRRRRCCLSTCTPSHTWKGS